MYLCRRALRKTPAPPPRLNVGQLVDQMTPEQIREINGQLVHYQIQQKSTFPSEGQRQSLFNLDNQNMKHYGATFFSTLLVCTIVVVAQNWYYRPTATTPQQPSSPPPAPNTQFLK